MKTVQWYNVVFKTVTYFTNLFLVFRDGLTSSRIRTLVAVSADKPTALWKNLYMNLEKRGIMMTIAPLIHAFKRVIR